MFTRPMLLLLTRVSHDCAAVAQGSATLSMAYAAALFADACLRGLNGAVATECTYVESTVVPDIPFFATKVKLGTEGELGTWVELGMEDYMACHLV